MDLTPDELDYLEELGQDVADLPAFSDEYVEILRKALQSTERLTLDQVLDRRSAA